MDTAVDICNEALELIAQTSIRSLDEKSTPAQRCNVHFRPALAEVLRSGGWRCARGRVRLSPLEERPAFGWAYQYQLPGDFLRIARLNEVDSRRRSCPPFEVEGQHLLTNEVAVNLVYIRDAGKDADLLARLDALCRRCVVLLLASKLSWAFQQSAVLRTNILNEYQLTLRQACGADAWDGSEERIPLEEGSDWLAARGGL